LENEIINMKNYINTFEGFLNEVRLNEDKMPVVSDFKANPTVLDGVKIKNLAEENPEQVFIIKKEYGKWPDDILAKYSKTETSITEFLPIDKYATMTKLEYLGSMAEVIDMMFGADEWPPAKQKELANEPYLSTNKQGEVIIDVQRGNISKFVKLAEKK